VGTDSVYCKFIRYKLKESNLNPFVSLLICKPTFPICYAVIYVVYYCNKVHVPSSVCHPLLLSDSKLQKLLWRPPSWLLF